MAKTLVTPVDQRMRLYKRRTPAERAWDEVFRKLKTWNLVHGRGTEGEANESTIQNGRRPDDG